MGPIHDPAIQMFELAPFKGLSLHFQSYLVNPGSETSSSFTNLPVYIFFLFGFGDLYQAKVGE